MTATILTIAFLSRRLVTILFIYLTMMPVTRIQFSPRSRAF